MANTFIGFQMKNALPHFPPPPAPSRELRLAGLGSPAYTGINYHQPRDAALLSAGPKPHVQPWTWGGVIPTANHIVSGQDGVLLMHPGEMDVRQVRQQICILRFHKRKLL